MLSLIIPVYRNEASIAPLLDAVAALHRDLSGSLEAVFVVDGSPDRSHQLLAEGLPGRDFASQLVLLSRNFGSFAAIRVGLQHARGDRFAVMAADLQEPPELVLEIDRQLREDLADVVVGVRERRDDPWWTRMASAAFWGMYRRFVVRDMPAGGVDIFGCNRAFRDQLMQLEERHSSLVAQVFWLGFRRGEAPYERRRRHQGRSAWTFEKRLRYLTDSIFSFTDLPIRLLIRLGFLGVAASGVLGLVVLVSRLMQWIDVPGYAMTIIVITFFGALNLLSLGIVGSYAWRAYENTKARPLAVPMRVQRFEPSNEVTS